MQRFGLLKWTSGEVWIDLKRVIAIQPAGSDRCLVWVEGMKDHLSVMISAPDLLQLIADAENGGFNEKLFT